MRGSWAIALALALAGCQLTSDAFVESCDNGLDEDGDGLVDCADPDCLGQCPELCGDAVDNDGDGAVDCADVDCDGTCPEQCGDGRDNDLDGWTDCADPDCTSCVERCHDGFDNDGDGAVDCEDPDCAGDTCPELCDDGFDNDGDGLADCADADCDGGCWEDCIDGRDNDGDGAVDCADPDCDGRCLEDCADGRDNDGNGRLDCADPACDPICDADADGFRGTAFGGPDCDDTSPDVHPDAAEVCNHVDDDCDGAVDDADGSLDRTGRQVVWLDADGDGHGAPDAPRRRCFPVDGYAPASDDCDDGDAWVFPGAAEVCNDVDDDCDGWIDEADADVDLSSGRTFWIDADGDGLGWAEGPTVVGCATPDGFAPNADDCDDADPSVGAPDLWVVDGDGDGHGVGAPVTGRATCLPPGDDLAPAAAAVDCDDTDPAISPSALEICADGIDQDCDGDDPPCVPACLRIAWKYGYDDWACPYGMRLPTEDERDRVEACVDAEDRSRFDYWHNIGIAVGGCGCKWNPDWCGDPSIDTFDGRMCGDFDQLHVCVAD